MAKRRTRPSSKQRLKKAQLSFYAEPEDYQALKALSATTGIPQQVYLREGLQMILQHRDWIAVANAVAVRHKAQKTMGRFKQVSEQLQRLLAERTRKKTETVWNSR